jgi:hypothetical protein
MRDILWHNFTRVKFNDEYICQVISKYRILINRYNIFILIFSTTGIFGWKIWEYYPVAVCVAISIISLIKLIEPHVIPSDKLIQKLDKISDFYSGAFIKLQRIWFDLENGTIDESEAMNRFHVVMEDERQINPIINEVIKKDIKPLVVRAKIRCDTYFSQAYKTQT